MAELRGSRGPELVVTAHVCTSVRCLGCHFINIGYEFESADPIRPSVARLSTGKLASKIKRQVNQHSGRRLGIYDASLVQVGTTEVGLVVPQVDD